MSINLPKLFRSALLDIKAIGKFVTLHGTTSVNPDAGTASVAVNAQVSTLGTSLLADVMATIKSADAAAKAKGLNFFLDAEVIADIEQLIADIEKLLPGSTTGKAS